MRCNLSLINISVLLVNKTVHIIRQRHSQLFSHTLAKVDVTATLLIGFILTVGNILIRMFRKVGLHRK